MALPSRAAEVVQSLAQRSLQQSAKVISDWVKQTMRTVSIDALYKAVEESKNPEYALAVARYIPGADVKRLEKIVIQAEDPGVARKFAQYVPGADSKIMEDIVVKRGSAWHAVEFAKGMKGADVARLQKKVLKSVSFNPDAAITFLKDIPGSDFYGIRNAVKDASTRMKSKHLDMALTKLRQLENDRHFMTKKVGLVNGALNIGAPTQTPSRLNRDIAGHFARATRDLPERLAEFQARRLGAGPRLG